MNSWLDPVRQALDESAAPADFFFRDDDVGWSDDFLCKLLRFVRKDQMHTIGTRYAFSAEARRNDRSLTVRFSPRAA